MAAEDLSESSTFLPLGTHSSTESGDFLSRLEEAGVAEDICISAGLGVQRYGLQRNNNFQNRQPYPPFQRPPPFPQPSNLPPPPQPKPPQPNSFEVALEKLTLTTLGFVQTTNNFIEEARANFRNQESAIRNLETQVGQIAK
ncbi:hypothetical protein PIB30_080434 [Stylosanthes scabra]|uniref:Uncharacterized protein n=1 Tax=Stylosanthes scabra TaxID=79078 RepID=A0ABU6SRK0_9FABA|nr:hypothetical protein [Stylosanthes scabra]